MNQSLTCTLLSKVFLILILFSLVTSSVLPYYFVEKMGIEHFCDSKEDKDAEEKEEEKKEEKEERIEKIRSDVNDIEYSLSSNELRYYNFKNFHYTHFQEIETPPPELLS